MLVSFTRWNANRSYSIRTASLSFFKHFLWVLQLRSCYGYEMLHLVSSYMKQKKKHKQTLESAPYGVEINFDQPRPQDLLLDDFQNGGSRRSAVLKIVEDKALGTRLHLWRVGVDETSRFACLANYPVRLCNLSASHVPMFSFFSFSLESIQNNRASIHKFKTENRINGNKDNTRCKRFKNCH